ncbi:hypothetical protein AB0L71_18940 [Streptomyces sp. NPDC052052]|uniref:hypothetical protein n=1 Tax=Streptomyces sp. NPDC052052 TaxID=3154756 RepID=UPI003415B50C
MAGSGAGRCGFVSRRPGGNLLVGRRLRRTGIRQGKNGGVNSGVSMLSVQFPELNGHGFSVLHFGKIHVSAGAEVGRNSE